MCESQELCIAGQRLEILRAFSSCCIMANQCTQRIFLRTNGATMGRGDQPGQYCSRADCRLQSWYGGQGQLWPDDVIARSWESQDEVMRRLLSSGAVIDTRDIYGRTPVSRTAEHGHVAVIQELLGSGADVNASDKRDKTNFDYAARLNRTDMVQELF